MPHFRILATGACQPAAAFRATHSGAGRRRAGGFTLIELMITVSLTGILLAVGVPAMQRFLTSRGTIGQAEDLASTLRLARSDALRLNSQVTVCASTTPTSPTATCAGATAWATGWITFIDLDKDGSRTASSERLLRAQSPLNSIKAITSDASTVRFFPNGLAATGAASFEVQPKLNSSDSTYTTVMRRVCLYGPGRVVIKPGTGSC